MFISFTNVATNRKTQNAKLKLAPNAVNVSTSISSRNGNNDGVLIKTV
jgi:hypothetical protein